MNTDCYPCIARGALDAARLATPDETLQLAVLKKILGKLSVLDPDWPPPLMARFIQETVGEMTGVRDPYARLKEKYNTMALAMMPELTAMKAGQDALKRFETGVRLAIAGNIIDFGTASTVGRKKLIATITHAMETRVTGSVDGFRTAVEGASHILWLGDNAGEIVFDRLLLEEMDCGKVIYAVRGGPIQNDATIEDARTSGLTEMVRVMDTGALIPGTLLPYCTDAFVREFERADLIISKGQGNFETLDHDDPRVYFLFKAKCGVVARQAGCDLGDVVIKQGGVTGGMG
ncbi:MAG: ARMT1-like domain-containing protein [Desulfobacterales bacterium]|nr:ARMT1-like domain-containing protein [Desulfobacterales bacterium]